MRTTKSRQTASAAPSFNSLVEQLGASMAAVIEHPACPQLVRNELASFACEVFNAAEGVQKQAADARLLLPACMAMLANAAR